MKAKALTFLGMKSFEFNGWTVNANAMATEYSVVKNGRTIVKIYEKFWCDDDVYFIDIVKPEDEILGLLLALAIDSSKTTKGEDNKKALQGIR